jgi:hypothetical protein
LMRMRIRIRLFTLMWRKGTNPWKNAQIGSYYIHFGLSSANWCRSGSSLLLWCGSTSASASWILFDADPDADLHQDFYLMRMRFQVTKLMRIYNTVGW